MKTTAIREKPIPFSEPMVIAVREDRKTMTRRVCIPQPSPRFLARGVVGLVPQWPTQDGVRWFMADGCSELVKSPWRPGDRLWVREMWAVHKRYDALPGRDLSPKVQVVYKAGGVNELGAALGRWRAARFMPRWASRIKLKVTGVHIERLQEISNADIRAEGFFEGDAGGRRMRFCATWDKLNSKREGGIYAWDKSPWVWVVSFCRVEETC